MGRVTVTAATVLAHPRAAVWAFATDPNNWGRSYTGSGGLTNAVPTPIAFGAAWTERVGPPPQAYASRWTAVRVERPYQFVIQQTGGLGARLDGSDAGVDGCLEIKYTFEEAAAAGAEGTETGGTLFTRTLTLELPRGTRIPDELLTVCCQTWAAEEYHDSIAQQLDQQRRA